MEQAASPIAITRPSSGTFLPRRPPSSYPFLVAPTRRCGLLAASGAHPPGAIPTRPYLGGSLTRDARLLGPSRPAREATSLREVPASLPLLARAREAGRPPREVPAFSALLARPRRASYSPTRPFFLPPVAVLGPHLAHLLAPSPPAPAGVSPPRPGKAPPFLALHDPLEGRGKKGRVGFCC